MVQPIGPLPAVTNQPPAPTLPPYLQDLAEALVKYVGIYPEPITLSDVARLPGVVSNAFMKGVGTATDFLLSGPIITTEQTAPAFGIRPLPELPQDVVTQGLTQAGLITPRYEPRGPREQRFAGVSELAGTLVIDPVLMARGGTAVARQVGRAAGRTRAPWTAQRGGPPREPPPEPPAAEPPREGERVPPTPPGIGFRPPARLAEQGGYTPPAELSVDRYQRYLREAGAELQALRDRITAAPRGTPERQAAVDALNAELPRINRQIELASRYLASALQGGLRPRSPIQAEPSPPALPPPEPAPAAPPTEPQIWVRKEEGGELIPAQVPPPTPRSLANRPESVASDRAAQAKLEAERARQQAEWETEISRLAKEQERDLAAPPAEPTPPRQPAPPAPGIGLPEPTELSDRERLAAALKATQRTAEELREVAHPAVRSAADVELDRLGAAITAAQQRAMDRTLPREERLFWKERFVQLRDEYVNWGKPAVATVGKELNKLQEELWELEQKIPEQGTQEHLNWLNSYAGQRTLELEQKLSGVDDWHKALDNLEARRAERAQWSEQVYARNRPGPAQGPSVAVATAGRAERGAPGTIELHYDPEGGGVYRWYFPDGLATAIAERTPGRAIALAQRTFKNFNLVKLHTGKDVSVTPEPGPPWGEPAVATVGRGPSQLSRRTIELRREPDGSYRWYYLDTGAGTIAVGSTPERAFESARIAWPDFNLFRERVTTPTVRERAGIPSRPPPEELTPRSVTEIDEEMDTLDWRDPRYEELEAERQYARKLGWIEPWQREEGLALERDLILERLQAATPGTPEYEAAGIEYARALTRLQQARNQPGPAQAPGEPPWGEPTAAPSSDTWQGYQDRIVALNERIRAIKRGGGSQEEYLQAIAEREALMQGAGMREAGAEPPWGEPAEEVPYQGQTPDEFEAMLARRRARGQNIEIAPAQRGAAAPSVSEQLAALEARMQAARDRMNRTRATPEWREARAEFDAAHNEWSRLRAAMQPQQAPTPRPRTIDEIKEEIDTLDEHDPNYDEKLAPLQAELAQARQAQAQEAKMRLIDEPGFGTPEEQANVEAFWKGIAEQPESFEYGAAPLTKEGLPETDIHKIAEHYSIPENRMVVREGQDRQHGKHFAIINTRTGGVTYIDDIDKPERHIYSLGARGPSGEAVERGGGNQAFQIAATWAHNNDLPLYHDTAVTNINTRRRLENAISSYLRHGTRRHITLEEEVAEADTWGGLFIESMNKNYREIRRYGHHELIGIEFNGKGFVDAEGKPMTRDDIHAVTDRLKSGKRYGLGPSTLMRIAMTRWARTASRPAIIEAYRKFRGKVLYVFATLAGAKVLERERQQAGHESD